MRKYLVEFLGTFFLVLVILTVSEPLALLAIGSILMVMVYAGGHISGAHYNPAVTLAVWIRGRIALPEAIGYIMVQVAGALAAALVANYLTGYLARPMLDLSGRTIEAIVAEIIGTFALAYVVLNVATAKSTSGNSFYGLAIGFTVLACAASLGKFSGGAFNPAVAIGLSVAEVFSWSDIWIYVVGCFGGAMIAAFLFRYLNPGDK